MVEAEPNVTSRCGRARASSSVSAAQGIPQAIATSSRRPTVERYLGRVGLLDRFAAIVSREDVEKPKPAPDPFLTAAARLGLAPADCLALEDSYHGIASAHAAGMMAIMVPDLLAVTDAVRAQCITVADDLHVVGALLQAQDPVRRRRPVRDRAARGLPGFRELEHAVIIVAPANDLHADRQPCRRERRVDRHGRLLGEIPRHRETDVLERTLRIVAGRTTLRREGRDRAVGEIR